MQKQHQIELYLQGFLLNNKLQNSIRHLIVVEVPTQDVV